MSSRKLRFDGWILDPESGDLERSGARIRLQEQPVQVLRELIAHAGSVVPREQLIALLWPKGVVDFDTGLNVVIRKLRSALGDTSDTPRYIETLPRRGYRFIGTLDPDPEAASGASAALAVAGAVAASSTPGPPSHQEPKALSETGLAEPKSMPGGRDPAAPDEATASTAMTIAPVRPPRLPALALIAALAVVALLTGVYALWRARSGASATSVRVEAPSQSGLPANVAPTNAVAFSPPPHSIAVLPFVNISGDKEQEYFSDGLTEELLNSLSHIDGLQVAARTSSFSFKEHPDITDVAHKLNVATVLEGSVRRSGHTMRITAQLNNAVTGFHLWSQTYDRDLSDALKLQTDIATAVAGALKVTMLGDVGARIELGGSRNPTAVDEYLRGTTRTFTAHTPDDYRAAIVSFSEAIRLDPNYALAFAGRSLALSNSVCGKCAALTRETPRFTARARRDTLDEALADAREAIARAPELAEGHLALAWVLENSLDFVRAKTAHERALTLAPGSARVLKAYGAFAINMGWADAGIAALRRAVVLDPLNRNAHRFLGEALFNLRRYQDSITAYREALAIDPDDSLAYADIGMSYYALGDFQEARSWCEAKPDPFASACLALTYDKLGRHADAAAELAKFRTDSGDAYPYWNALIYAGWGDTVKALGWLERDMMRDRDWYLEQLKVDPFLDSLRNEPRFQAVMRELRFPD